MYDFDPDEYSYTSSEQVVAYNSIRETYVVVFKNMSGFITHEFIWMEPVEMSQEDAEILFTRMPAYGEC